MTQHFQHPKEKAGMHHGIVGLNFRNRHLVAALNPRAEINTARDKNATKERLHQAGVPVPPTFAVIQSAAQIKGVYTRLCEKGQPFVIKPARSAKGRGILLCRSASSDGVDLISGRHLSKNALLFHLHQILHGEFSFGRPHDAIIVEQLLQTDANWVHPGLPAAPDLRIIICKGTLLLAMARLPTSLSDGRANLHCGAVGAGIDPQSGLTTSGTQFGKPVSHHPDTGYRISGQPVSDFEACMDIAMRCAAAFKLGFIGIDIMRDIAMGPVVLEVNARPGLTIQLANRTGLLTRLASI
ncbi:MAG: hypothetical protein RL648_374 [Verrucomicrobiota bacterium]|jgi:alpha-L-glutamate ligase-like protein